MAVLDYKSINPDAYLTPNDIHFSIGIPADAIKAAVRSGDLEGIEIPSLPGQPRIKGNRLIAWLDAGMPGAEQEAERRPAARGATGTARSHPGLSRPRVADSAIDNDGDDGEPSTSRSARTTRPAADVVEEFIADKAASGVSRTNAIRQLHRSAPKLVQRWQNEATQARGQASETPRQDGTPATDEWNQKIAEKVAGGVDRQRAASAVNRENPGLRERMLAEANAH